MEVKIGDEMIDAKIVMMNGDMIVSPKVVKFEPKDGDVVACEDYDCLELFIFKEQTDKIECTCYCYYCEKDNCLCVDNDEYIVSRFASEEEKKKLFDKLAEEGLEWKPDTKEFVKLKWKPEIGKKYYYPDFSEFNSSPDSFIWNNDDTDEDIYARGWCFKTEEECQEFCNRLNEAIKSVKP